MKIWIIKRKGKTWWGNITFGTMTITKGNKEYQINSGEFFLRKKDAQKYLSDHPYPEFYEVVSAEVQQSKIDNRKK